MLEQSLLINLSIPDLSENATSQLRLEYQACQELIQAQPQLVRQHLDTQANNLTDAIIIGASRVHYSLPELVALQTQSTGLRLMPVDSKMRNQRLGGILNRLVRFDSIAALHSQLLRLERSSDSTVSSSAILMRHALVMHMVHDYLPAGRNAQYLAEEDDEIPCHPVYDLKKKYTTSNKKSVITATDVDRNDQAPEEPGLTDFGIVDAFFLPQWVAFDVQNHLLVGDLKEAEDHIKSIQRYLFVLNTAVALAPYMVVDEEYQSKRYGILGQLVNQGRAFASYQVELMCQTIKHRSGSHDLDQGLSISLPYFNDKTLAIETYNFDVIPKGRVMFVPAFVVLAVRTQGVKVAQDTRLSQSTRKTLLKELCLLERAFLR